MNKTTLIACVAVATALTTSTFAVTPASRDTGSINFASIGNDLSGWHLAMFAGSSTKYMENDRNIETEIDFTRFNVILGYDVMRWLTVYGLVGAMKEETGLYSKENDTQGLFGVGVWADLIESDQLSRLSDVSSYRLTSGAEYSLANFDDFTWSQIEAFLTFELINELNRTSFIMPETIGLFFGPVVSYVLSDEYDAGDNIGVTVGLNMTMTDDTYITVAGDFYADDRAIYGMVGVRF